MRLLIFFLCFLMAACGGPQTNANINDQPVQDTPKPLQDQAAQNGTKSTKTLNSELNISSDQQDAALEEKNNLGSVNTQKLPVLTQDNVVPLLTEFGIKHPENKVVIKTRFGPIKIELFEETPLHRANFLYLIEQDYFKDTFFHRIVPEFIIQGGNSDLRSTPQKRKSIGPKYRIPAEINPNRKHTYGTISGAKEYRENPDKLSAPYEFFIFCGPDISGRHLNGNYTIFGRVTQGMDVVETISNLPADQGEWPKSNVYIDVSLEL